MTLTLIASKIMIDPMPRIVSEGLSSLILVITNFIVGKKFELPPPPVRPSSPFNCDAPIINAVADVKPIVTGREIKSTKAPSFRSAIISSTTPERKHRSTAKLGPAIPFTLVCRLVIKARSAEKRRNK